MSSFEATFWVKTLDTILELFTKDHPNFTLGSILEFFSKDHPSFLVNLLKILSNCHLPSYPEEDYDYVGDDNKADLDYVKVADDSDDVGGGGKRGKMKCNWCSARFSKHSGNAGLLHHKKTKHFWGIFKCAQCTFVAHFAGDLLNHQGGNSIVLRGL